MLCRCSLASRPEAASSLAPSKVNAKCLNVSMERNHCHSWFSCRVILLKVVFSTRMFNGGESSTPSISAWESDWMSFHEVSSLVNRNLDSVCTPTIDWRDAHNLSNGILPGIVIRLVPVHARKSCFVLGSRAKRKGREYKYGITYEQ